MVLSALSGTRGTFLCFINPTKAAVIDSRRLLYNECVDLFGRVPCEVVMDLMRTGGVACESVVGGHYGYVGFCKATKDEESFSGILGATCGIAWYWEEVATGEENEGGARIVTTRDSFHCVKAKGSEVA